MRFMKKFKLFLALGIVLSSINFYAQQDPQYTQYMYNMNVLNPAYAGSRGTLSIGVLGRTQWVGIDGAPKTFTFSAHAPFSKKVGLGLSAIVDKIGPVKEQNVFADFSYTINTSVEGKLAFGLKAGFTFHNLNEASLIAIDPNDPNVLDFENRTFPNFGAGAFYYTDKFYIGLSMPNVLETKHFSRSNGITKASEKTHYFLTSGYIFNLSQHTKFKPSIMAKAVNGAPLSLDLSANFLFNERFEIGASYRLDDSISGLVGFLLTKDLRLGYAYDYTTTNLGNFNSGSHEVFLQWDIDLSRDKVVSPRFF